jgi:hypothetical protein
MDIPALVAVAAATTVVQVLSEALQPGSLQQHKVSLPSFRMEDLVGWFQHAEAEFLLVRIPANSYVCSMHVVHALPSEALTTVCDLTSEVTAATPDQYNLIKDALFARFTPSPLQMWFCLLGMLPLGDRRQAPSLTPHCRQLPRPTRRFASITTTSVEWHIVASHPTMAGKRVKAPGGTSLFAIAARGPTSSIFEMIT